MQLQEHFALSEMTATTYPYPNTPTEAETANLRLVAFGLEVVQAHWNKPVLISSAFRSEDVNKAAGGVSNSSHRLGLAVDFTIPGVPVETVFAWIRDSSGLPFDQLIDEKRGSTRWIHLAFARPGEKPRRQAFKDWK